MPHPKQSKKLGNGRGGSPEPGPSKRHRHISSDEEDDPFPRKGAGASCSKMSKLGKINKKVPSVTKLGGMHTSCHNKPAELFRKDLISAMKLPDTEILYESEYVVISDPWRQEWEKGVQVPVNEENMRVVIDTLKKDKVEGDFKLPLRKFLHEYSDETYEPGKHELTHMQEMAEQIVRYDLDDQDVRWLELVNQDREEMGLQLINEWNLERMIEELENQCYAKTNSLKKTEEGLGIEYDEDVACDVCRMLESEDTNEMVFCDGCDICVHQACYGIQSIPEGTWLCRICALGIKPMCLLCPKRGGAMKPTKSGTKWTHVSCALWIPEVSIGCPEKMEPITMISNIPPSRWALVCCLCKERVGACIQCSVKQCKTAFHVTCGFAHNLDMKTIVDDSDDVDGIHLRAYCPKHSKNRNASDSDSPKKEEESQEDEENGISEAEMAKKRNEKLNQLEEEFYTLVDQCEISKKFYIPEEAVDIVAEYWKLKRKANNNKPLITPKMEEEDQMQRQQKDSLTARMKMFVHLRQDLERARNLCYMISKREKMKRQLFNVKEDVFRAQLQVLTDPELNLSARDAERVRQMTRFNSIYSDHSNRSSLSSKPPRENLFTLENLKTPKDHEEEKRGANGGERTVRKESGKKKHEERKSENNDAEVKKKKRVKIKNKTTVTNVNLCNVEENKTEDDDDVSEAPEIESKETNVLLLDGNKDHSEEETSSKSRLGKVSLKEIEERTDTGEPSDIKAMAEEPVLPNKKNFIPSDLQKKLTSILQSKTIMQKRQEKSDSLSESLLIDVENSDSETTSPEMKAEVALPVEERMNLFDQFSKVPDLGSPAKTSPKWKNKGEVTLPAATDVSVDTFTESYLPQNSPDDIQEKRSRHSSHKKAKRRKHSRSSHKHKKARRSATPDASDRFSISSIIIKAEGDTRISGETSHKTTKRDKGESPVCPDSDGSLSGSIQSDFQSSLSFSKSAKNSKKKRSRRDRSDENINDRGKGSPSPDKVKRHHHQKPLSPPSTTTGKTLPNFDDEEHSRPTKIQETEHFIHLEDLPSPNKEESGRYESRGKLHSKLRLKKQLSPVKGVVSYEVVKDEEDKIISNGDEIMKSGVPNKEQKGEPTKTLTQSDIKSDQELLDCKDSISSQKLEELETKHSLLPCKKDKHISEEDVISKSKIEEERKSKWEDSGLRTRQSKLDETSVSKVKEEPVSVDKTIDTGLLSIVTESTPSKRRTRHRLSHQEVSNLSPTITLEDSSDENYRPDGKSPKVLPLGKLHRPQRLRARRQLHPDETEGDDDEEDEVDSKRKAESEEGNVEKDIPNITKKKTNSHRSNGLTRRGVKLKSPLPEKPEINKMLLDPDKLIVKSSLRRKVGERLASSLKGRSRWPTINSKQPTLDRFVQRANSCENVFSKPNIVRDPNAKQLSLPLARSDMSPLSVNKSSSVVNSTQGQTSPVSNVRSPVSSAKSPTVPTNVIFGAHSSPRGSLNTYRIPRRAQNSSLNSQLKDHNSSLDGVKANSELSSTTTDNINSVFGGSEKLRRPLSFENIGSHGDNPDSSQHLRESNIDLSAVVYKCDTSKLSEDHLDGTQSYRSPSPVSSITSVASSKQGKLQAGRGDYEEDEEENTPTKRITRSQILEEVTSPSTRLRNREVIVSPPKLTLS